MKGRKLARPRRLVVSWWWRDQATGAATFALSCGHHVDVTIDARGPDFVVGSTIGVKKPCRQCPREEVRTP